MDDKPNKNGEPESGRKYNTHSPHNLLKGTIHNGTSQQTAQVLKAKYYHGSTEFSAAGALPLVSSCYY